MASQPIGTPIPFVERPRMHKQQTHAYTIKRVIKAFSPYKFRVFLVVLAIIVSTVLNLVTPLLIAPVFDTAIPHRDFRLLLIYASIMFSASVLSGFVGILQTYLNNIIGQRVMRDFRNRLYNHLQAMSLRFFTGHRTGEIQSRLSNDVSAAQSAVTDTLTTLLSNLWTVIGTTIAMFYINPMLALISIILAPPFLWMTYKVGNVRRRLTRATQQSLASLNALTQETLSVNGIILSKTFGRRKYAQDRFAHENQTLTNLGIRQQMVGRWFFMLTGTFFAIMPIVIYVAAGWLLIYQAHSGNITIGSIIAFITLQGRFFGPISQLLALQVNVQGALALFDRIFEYLDMPLDIQDAPDALHLASDDVSGEVAFHDVSFSYKREDAEKLPELVTRKDLSARKALTKPSDLMTVTTHSTDQLPRTTLNNISFDVKSGQLTALVGPSGAGKTTITYLIPRLYDVDSGSIEIDGHNIKNISLDSLGDLIGMVTQETYLFHTSVRENLLYACPGAAEEEMIRAAKAAAIHDRIMELDDGYDTIVGERGYRLSGGEKQRVAIARVLLKKPRILVLDEATSSLDTHSERLIQVALEPLMKHFTTIAIAHRLSTILAADCILVVDQGEIVERGTHKELLNYGGMYTKLYNEQFAAQSLEELPTQ